MPAKGTKLVHGNRDYVFDKTFYKQQIVGDERITLSYADCKKIIESCNKNIAKAAADEIDGFKLPFGLGYICVTKYKPTREAIDIKNTTKLGKTVYHLNLHTLGYSCKVGWYRVGRISNLHFHEIFKFKAYRTLSRSVSGLFRDGKAYAAISIADFIEQGRLANMYNKKFRKEQKS